MNGRSGKALKWILLGCGGAVVLGVVAIGGCAILIMNLTKAPVEASEKFLTAMGAADWAGAKAAADPAVGASLESVAKTNPAVWGKEWSVSGRSINSNNGVTTGVVTVSLKGTDGTSRTVEMTLLDSGGWKVTAVKVNGAQVMPAGVSEAPPSGGELRIGGVEVAKSENGDKWEVRLNLEVRGLKFEAKGSLKRVSAVEGARVTSPDGTVIINEPELKAIDDAGEDPVVTFTNTFTIPKKAGAGTYRVRITVRDRLGDTRVEKDVDVQLP